MTLLPMDRDPSRRQLAVFGSCWLLFFAVVGGVVLHRGGPLWPAVACWVAAVTVPLAGCVAPVVLRTAYVAMAFATFPVGWVLSWIVLAAVYYVVLTPIGLLYRWFRQDPLHRRFDPRAETYWMRREGDPEVGQYFKQH